MVILTPYFQSTNKARSLKDFKVREGITRTGFRKITQMAR